MLEVLSGGVCGAVCTGCLRPCSPLKAQELHRRLRPQNLLSFLHLRLPSSPFSPQDSSWELTGMMKENQSCSIACVRQKRRLLGASFWNQFLLQLIPNWLRRAVNLIYEVDSGVIRERRFSGIQALSGTGAYRLFAEFQSRFYPESHIYFPNPTWSNHHNIWRDAKVP